MKNNNKFLGKFAAGAVSVAMLAGANSAFAAGMNDDGPTPHEGLVSALVLKFGISKTDVESVFKSFHESERTKMEARRMENEKERLAGAVATGKITQAQVDLITAKQAEVKSKMDALMKDTSKGGNDRRAQISTIMDDLNTWAKNNNIPEKYIHAGGRGHMGAMNKGRGFER
jgi:hypothetical protein